MLPGEESSPDRRRDQRTASSPGRRTPGRPDRYGQALLAAQGVAMAGLAWPGHPRWALPRPVAALAALVGLAGATVAEEGVRFLGRDLTPFVEPGEDARLYTTGPFSASRHPVYAGGLLLGAALAVLRRRPEPLAAFALLAGVLHLKANVEERHLRERFGVAYVEYAAATPRLFGVPRTNL